MRVFVGSSRESLEVAEGIRANLDDQFEVRLWTDDLFEPGKFTLEALEEFTRSFDAAVFVLGADDVTDSRGREYFSPRDNVLLEAGIFLGHMGRGRVFLVAHQSAADRPPLKLPTDLAGLTLAWYRVPSDGNFRAATAASCVRIARALLAAGALESDCFPGVPTVRTFLNLATATEAMRADLEGTTHVKILANKGLPLFGVDESVVSLADLGKYPDLRQIRIVLMDEESPWISESWAALRRYESREAYSSELRNQHEIAEAALARAVRARGLTRSGIRYHRNVPYFRAFLTDSVAYVSSYAEPPDTQVRDLPVFRIESHAGSIYGALKRHFDELWDNESRPGTYLADHFMLEESAGGIVVWLDPEEESPFVALTQRSDGSWVLPKGHREISDESLEVTAIREIGEETGLAASSLRVVRSLDLYAAQETYADLGRPVHKVVHLYEVRCDAAEMPRMTPDADHAAARWWSLRDRLPPMHYEAQRIALSTYAEETYGIRTWF